MTFPFSFFSLSSDISEVECVFTDTTGNQKTSIITIPSGNYNCINVLEQLSQKLIQTASISSGSYVGYTPVFDFQYSSVTGKSSYRMVSPVGSASILIRFSTNKSLGLWFGFSGDALISNTQIQSTRYCVANPINNLFLRCGNLRQRHNREWIVEQAVFSDIVYKLAIATQQNSYIQSYDEGDLIEIVDNNINELNFYVTTNLSYTPVDINDVDIGFSFSFTITEEIIPSYEPITNDLALNERMFIPPPSIDPEILKQLDDEKQRQLMKLQKYRDKLEKKNNKDNKDNNKENTDKNE